MEHWGPDSATPKRHGSLIKDFFIRQMMGAYQVLEFCNPVPMRSVPAKPDGKYGGKGRDSSAATIMQVGDLTVGIMRAGTKYSLNTSMHA